MDPHTVKASPADHKAAVQLLSSFTGLLKAVPLYPKGHQILLQIIEKFYGVLQKMLSERPLVVIRIFENKVFVNDADVSPDTVQGGQDFVQTLQRRYIRQIMLAAGATLTDVSALVNVLTSSPEDVAGQGGAAAMLIQSATQTVRIIEYYVRRHADFSQEQLINITHGEVFHFFVDDTAQLTHDQALSLYEMMKDPRLMSELTRIAGHYATRAEPGGTVDPGTMLRILEKIRATLSQYEFSEEKELKEMNRAVIAQYDPETMFSLLYEHPDDPQLETVASKDKAAGLFKPDELAELMSNKVKADPANREVIGHVKKVLERLFLDRQSLMVFLPLFKERLEAVAPQQQARKMLNEVCAAFAPGFSLEEELELALGTANAQEQQVLVEGLQALKSVTIDRQELQGAAQAYPSQRDHGLILQALLSPEQSPEVFGSVMRRLYRLLLEYLEKDDQASSSGLFDFFVRQMGTEGSWKNQHKELVREMLAELPEQLLERFLVEMLCAFDPQKVRRFLSEMTMVLGRKLISLVLKTYTREEQVPNRDVLQEYLCLQQETGLMVLDAGVRQETSASAGRILDLLQYMQTDSVLPLLWELTFHEDIILAQRALKIIADRNNDASRQMLLKSLNHTQPRVRLEAIELLAKYRHPDVIAVLTQMAFPEGPPSDDNAVIQRRCAALTSLGKLDPERAKGVLRQILQRKKLVFIPLEPKSLRQFAREQLRRNT